MILKTSIERLCYQIQSSHDTLATILQVHERDCITDLTLLVVRKLLRTNSKHVKVRCASALHLANKGK